MVLRAVESRLAIKAQFDERFAQWGVELPRGAAEHRVPGWLRAAGWSIAFVWGEAEDVAYLDYEAEHRMTDPEHVRLWGNGPGWISWMRRPTRYCSE